MSASSELKTNQFNLTEEALLQTRLKYFMTRGDDAVLLSRSGCGIVLVTTA